MSSRLKRIVRAHGLKLLLSSHRDIRRLKQSEVPSLHGYKHWGAGWVLIDYIRSRGLRTGSRVMDLGCGWGLLGIFCAREYGARVVGVDKDPAVFPFLRLHAGLNDVRIETLCRGYEDLRRSRLERFDVILGSDICFWDNLINPLRLLILRGLRAGVRAVVIADPGRETFEELGRYFMERNLGEMIDWSTSKPRGIRGRILRIEPLQH